jgi:cytochrome P450
MFLTIILITAVACLLAIYLWTINNRYDYFKRRGIPVPPYRFFFGHYKELWSTQSFSKQLQTWTRQYGSIYGLFEGSRPLYVVSDVNFLEEVYIKQFSSFNTRRLSLLIRRVIGHRIHLFRANGPTWRRHRHVINPTFSSAKLKLMTPLIDGCIEAMLKKLPEKNTEINIYELYKRMTMDVICE